MAKKSKTQKAYLILEFKDAEQKSRFVGGLLDGWGENAPLSVDWDSGKVLPDHRSEIHAGEAPLLRVTVHKDDFD